MKSTNTEQPVYNGIPKDLNGCLFNTCSYCYRLKLLHTAHHTDLLIQTNHKTEISAPQATVQIASFLSLLNMCENYV